MVDRILVAGASGYVGRRLVFRLLSAGYSVRCLVRHMHVEERRGWRGAELVEADLLDPETLPAALDGVEVIYYLVHSLGGGEAKFSQYDLLAAGNMAKEAYASGIGRIIYLGGLGNEMYGLTAHLRSRQETGEVLRSYGVPMTEFRAGPIIGNGSMSFEILRTSVERLPIIVWPRWLSTPCQPISIRDVLAYLVAALEEPRSIGEIIEIGGADVLSYGEMMLEYAVLCGRYRPIVPVPLLGPHLSAYAASVITSTPLRYARPLLENLLTPVVVTDNMARDLFPLIEPLDYRESVQLALRRARATLQPSN
jgi:uncharacterized protein YbjT (DUF2867 family)